MESENNDASNLLMGILRDSKQELRNLEESADSYARTRREAARKQADEILAQAKAAAAQARTFLLKKAESKAAVDARKVALQARDRILEAAVQRARRLCEERIACPDYASVLEGWIVEAAVGLDKDAATVNASERELPLVTDSLLRSAEGAVHRITGKTIRLRREEGKPLSSQGVVLTAEGGRVAYNNQVTTRSLRLQKDIQRLAYEALFDEGN